MNSAATTQRKDVKGKERVRGPKLAILVKETNGVPFVEGLARVDKENRVIASNKRLDKPLNESDEVDKENEWQRALDLFICWSGTMTGYKEPGEKFGDYVIYTDPETKQRYVFPVPEDYKGAKDAILVVEHPDYTLEPGKKEVIERIQDLNRIILPGEITERDLIVAVQNLENISLIENFPSENGWYRVDAKHGIPIENKVNSSNDDDARHLWRIEDGSRIGLVARCYCFDNFYGSRDVLLLYDWSSSNGLGVVVVEDPERNKVKLLNATQRKTENVKGKERIRGPELDILVKRANGVPFEEGLARVDKENRVFPSNARLDKALSGRDEWKSISDVFPCWSGTMTGYEKPGKKLGKSIVYTDPATNQRYVFPVPEDYKGAKDAILVVEHPDYTLDRDGKDLVVAVQNLENISLIEGFPSKDGWYLTDAKHGIPTGNEVDPFDSDARYLGVRGGSRVGPVARGDYYDLDHYWRYVVLDYWPSDCRGVAVEAPAGGPEKQASPAVQQAEHAPEKLQIERKEGKLIIKGTPEQLDAAIKLLQINER